MGLYGAPMGRSHESASMVVPIVPYQNSIVSFAIARSFSLELDRLSRGDLMASRCIKRFIFARMTGSRASWHNASGNSRADSGSHPDILTGVNHRCTDRYSTRLSASKSRFAHVLYIIDKCSYREYLRYYLPAGWIYLLPIQPRRHNVS